jgi:hypothetical protein
MRWWRWAAGILLVCAAIALSCGKGTDGSGDETTTPDGGTGQVGHGDDAGTDGGTGTDAGTGPDAGADAGIDGGTSDGGTDGGVAWTPPPAIKFPTPPGWTFYGPQNGGPHDVLQVTSDADGNIWVAGGEDGLFLLRPGATQFQRFTMADGLRPYGYLPDGSDPVGPKYLNVIAVTGGSGSSVYVGYAGLPGCEDAWDNLSPEQQPVRAYIYKSGDADHVTLAGSSLKVVHYDIFSGPGIVRAEPEGREKLCTIYRIVYDKNGGNLWFGGNHGFAWGDPNYAGITANPKCDGERDCSGLVEHSHPAFNGCSNDNGCGSWIWVTEDYRGIALAPDGDVWFGGSDRTTKFHWGFFRGSPVSRFDSAASLTEDPGTGSSCPAGAYPCYIQNRIDVWPDLRAEQPTNQTQPPLPSERIQDLVFGIAAMPNGDVYIGSGWLGLRRLDAFGNLKSDETARLFAKSVGAVARDPLDGTVWVGNRYAGGLHRLRPDGSTDHFALNTFGNLANMGIEDVQFALSGASRNVLVAFRSGLGNAGFVALYSGQ